MRSAHSWRTSGLSDVLKDIFGGVEKMLTGQKFQENIGTLRALTEEVVRGVFNANKLVSKDNLMSVLDDLAKRSKTWLWVEIVIKPVFLTMIFARAEREGDWLLHLEAFKEIISNHRQYMNDWKEKRKRKIIGYLCTYMPEEIVYAAGL